MEDFHADDNSILKVNVSFRPVPENADFETFNSEIVEDISESVETFNASFLSLESESNATFQPSFTDDLEFNSSVSGTYNSDTTDYNNLINKPKINGVKLQGDLDSSDLKIIYRGTTSYWNNQHGLIAEKNAIYVYTDYQEIDNGDGTFTILPGIKIGDGTSYLIDMPFTTSDNTLINQHLEDCVRHITAEERDFWNHKWSGYIDANDPENLHFTTNNVVLGDNNIHA